VSGKYTEELHRAPEDVLSFNEAVNQEGLIFPLLVHLVDPRLRLCMSSTPGYEGSMAPQNHSRISRNIHSCAEACSLTLSQLSRNVANLLGDVQEELELTLKDEFALEGHGGSPPIYNVCG
jgi:hypothetical protein